MWQGEIKRQRESQRPPRLTVKQEARGGEERSYITQAEELLFPLTADPAKLSDSLQRPFIKVTLHNYAHIPKHANKHCGGAGNE